jgi:hypothetical protein
MDMKVVRPFALTAAAVLLAVELIPAEDHKQQHVDRIPTIAVVSPAPASNVANAVVSYGPSTSGTPTGLVVPASGLYHLYVSVG